LDDSDEKDSSFVRLGDELVAAGNIFGNL